MPVPANAETIWDYLTSQGLSANAAAGILGNIEQESGGNPQAGSLGGGYGLIQWTPGTQYFSGPVSLAAQLPAIMAYIKANGSVADINAHASTPQAAALWFSTKYERPLAADANNANREASAAAVLAAAISGKWTGAKTSAETASGAAGTTPASASTSSKTTPASTSSGTGGTQAQLTSFNPLSPSSWISSIGNYILDQFGLSSFKELVIRGGLVVLGAILVIVGLSVLTGREVREVVRLGSTAAEAAE